MEKDLIYDVGFHNGDDTAYYLSEGYRVVGIEADPTLVEKGRLRFDKEIKQGRLTLLNVAIGPRTGVARFWLCEALSEWNSFDERVASRLGSKHQAIDVYCRQFRDILQEYGVPNYLKVDIENCDRYCIDGLDPNDPPRYLSMEFTRFEDLIALHRVGYNAFKVIYQAPGFHHAQFRAKPPNSLQLFSSRILKKVPPERRSENHAAIKTRIAGKILPGPSGPFGEETDGEWDNFEETCYHALSFVLGYSQHGNPPDWWIWFDIHATNQSDISPVPTLYD